VHYNYYISSIELNPMNLKAGSATARLTSLPSLTSTKVGIASTFHVLATSCKHPMLHQSYLVKFRM
jgi:hypothetical protein